MDVLTTETTVPRESANDLARYIASQFGTPDGMAIAEDGIRLDLNVADDGVIFITFIGRINHDQVNTIRDLIAGRR